MIAQLVERRTVEVKPWQRSLGRWFESGSRDNFLPTHFQTIELVHEKKNGAPGEDRTHDLQIALCIDSL